ncbi:arrestin domain protein [Teladorsagia circumcincta]|uniref:Arrestin domain protein n=1 Tax=Teladorsagia circumcincta TaxID=45464 RepID=A0A2G9UGX0_TELCI|nr:arrestin domain protein [Teladorsagia circumcincta]
MAEGLHGYIRYMVKVEIDRPWRFNKTDKRLFTVVPVFDLNTIPEAAMPIRESTVKNLGIVLFKHGKVSVQSEIPKTGFVPGETIVVNAHVINDSSKDIIKDICVQKKGRGNVQLYLQVPPTVPTFNCCPIVSVEYMVEVKFKTQASFKGDVISHCHIIVGTIPVGNPYVAPQPSAPPPDVPLPSSSGPSAPPLETPPPYPVVNGASVDPPPPPSYEEAVQGVAGTTMDTDDMEVSYELKGTVHDKRVGGVTRYCVLPVAVLFSF